jgi:hypothetical protein
MDVEFNAESVLANMRAKKKLELGQGEYARRSSKLDPYRIPIFNLYEKGASLAEIHNYIVTNLTSSDRKNGFKLHRTTIQKYIKRFTHG